MCHDLPVTGLGFAPKSTAKKAGRFEHVTTDCHRLFFTSRSQLIIHSSSKILTYFVSRRTIYLHIHRHSRIASFLLCRQQASLHQNRRRYVHYHNFSLPSSAIHLMICWFASFPHVVLLTVLFFLQVYLRAPNSHLSCWVSYAWHLYWFSRCFSLPSRATLIDWIRIPNYKLLVENRFLCLRVNALYWTLIIGKRGSMHYCWSTTSLWKYYA